MRPRHECTDLWRADNRSLIEAIVRAYGSWNHDPCQVVDSNEMLFVVPGTEPPANITDANSYAGGLLVFQCGRAGCNDPPGVSRLANWTFYLAPYPGPVEFFQEFYADPAPTVYLLTGYPALTAFNYRTHEYLCGRPPSRRACEVTINGHRPWRLLPGIKARVARSPVGRVVLPWTS